jgi:1,4-alpha-glucan branching enzyme
MLKQAKRYSDIPEGAMIKISAKTKKINFEFKPPYDAQTVSLVGDFNGWHADTHVMKKNANGTWKISAELKEGTYCFKYLVDNKDWINDESAGTAPNPYGSTNSVVDVQFK